MTTMPNSPDVAQRELLESLRTDREGALATVFEDERKRLRRLVECRMDRRLNGRLDASDIVQQTFISASSTLDNYLAAPNVPMYVWIRSIAFGVIAEAARFHLSTQKRAVDLERRGDDQSQCMLVNELSQSMASPASQVAQEEMLLRVNEAIEEMSAADRDILTLIHVELLSTTEAAAELNIQPATARQRHLRAIRRLRSSLDSIRSND